MQKTILFVTFIFSMQLAARANSLDWVAREVEACILEQTISDGDQVFLPIKVLENNDPETKMPEKGFYTFSDRMSILYFPNLCLLGPFNHGIDCFSGFTNLANAP